MRHLALLIRAVNVGGTGKLPMAELRALLAEEGFEAPETLLASGNAVVGTALSPAAAERKAEAALKARFGLSTDVFARDLAELKAVTAANPYPDFAREQPSKLMVVFLKGEPPTDLSGLTKYATLGEQVARGPRCLFIAYPEGSGRSKLAQAKGLAVGTSRNWNTVVKLCAALAR